MSFRKAGSQEAYTPGSSSSIVSPTASSAGAAARPAKKSRFARADGGGGGLGAVPVGSGAVAVVEEVQDRYVRGVYGIRVNNIR